MREANEIKTARARRLRRNSTDAENALWYRLRSRALGGYKFVRQEPIGPYTVDLVCRESRLIIEVDGGQHADNPRDAARDKWLVDHNYRVLRFWNNDVIGNVAGVLETIAIALAEMPLTRIVPTMLPIARTIRPLPTCRARLSGEKIVTDSWRAGAPCTDPSVRTQKFLAHV